MSKFELTAEVREFRGKEKAKKLRAAGKFPAIVYGAEKEPVSLTVPIHDADVLLQRIHGEKVLVDLSYGDKTDMVFVRNVQRDPVTEKLLHADFYRVDPNREIETKVPVVHVGTAAGVKTGGLLEHGIREVEIYCLPTKVPGHVEIDVTDLTMGHSIHVRDMDPIDGVEILTNPDSVLFSVVGKKMEEEPEEGEGEELAEGAAPEGEGEGEGEAVAAEEKK